MAKIFLAETIDMEGILKFVFNFKKTGLCFFVSFMLMCVSIFAVSCKMTAEGIVSAADDVGNPVLAEFSQSSADSVCLSFTEPVVLSGLEVRSGNPASMGELMYSEGELEVRTGALGGSGKASGSPETPMTSEAPSYTEFQVVFPEESPLEPGEAYILSGLACDKEGNSLLFQVPFHGFNTNVAGIVLSEVRTEASNAKKDNAKIEFVELYVHTSGDLAGMSLVNAVDEDKFGEYVFPSAEVDAGEYIVVHFRTAEDFAGACIDETSSDLNASTAPDSCADARDFWVPGTEARLGKSDVIVVRERLNGKIVDALLYAESGIKESAFEKLLPAAQQVVSEGGWSGTEDVATWVNGDGLTTTRTLSRQNIDEIDRAVESSSPIPVVCSDDWFVVATSSATPGLPNSTDKFSK